MRITKITDDRTISLDLNRNEARDIRDHLNNVEWNSLNDSAKALFHFLDMALTPSRKPAVPTFPGGGI